MFGRGTSLAGRNQIHAAFRAFAGTVLSYFRVHRTRIHTFIIPLRPRVRYSRTDVTLQDLPAGNILNELITYPKTMEGRGGYGGERRERPLSDLEKAAAVEKLAADIAAGKITTSEEIDAALDPLGPDVGPFGGGSFEIDQALAKLKRAAKSKDIKW